VVAPLLYGHIAVVDGDQDLHSAPGACENARPGPPEGVSGLDSLAVATQLRDRRPGLEIARPGVVHRSGVGLELIYEIVD
jgi:hypothetical protein